MTPDFRIIANGADLTEALRGRLLELRVTDEAGTAADQVEIRLDDRDGTIVLPPRGATLAVSLGYVETGLAGFGTYLVDEVEASGPPDTLSIRGRAADLRASLKAPRTRSWHAVTLGELVASVAAEHGYTPRVEASLAGISLETVHQTSESDLHLLSRLAQRYGATCKPAAGGLHFVPAGRAKTSGGRSLPAVALVRGDLTRWHVTLADRNRYGAVKARYRKLSTAREESVTVGSGTPVYELRHLYESKASASHAAKAEAEKLKRGVSSIDFTAFGDVRLAAEGRAKISGVRAGVDGEWVLNQAVHVYASGGYHTECKGKSPGEDAT